VIFIRGTKPRSEVPKKTERSERQITGSAPVRDASGSGSSF
jgi:hypothetical protein